MILKQNCFDMASKNIYIYIKNVINTPFDCEEKILQILSNFKSQCIGLTFLVFFVVYTETSH